MGATKTQAYHAPSAARRSLPRQPSAIEYRTDAEQNIEHRAMRKPTL